MEDKIIRTRGRGKIYKIAVNDNNKVVKHVYNLFYSKYIRKPTIAITIALNSDMNVKMLKYWVHKDFMEDLEVLNEVNKLHTLIMTAHKNGDSRELRYKVVNRCLVNLDIRRVKKTTKEFAEKWRIVYRPYVNYEEVKLDYIIDKINETREFYIRKYNNKKLEKKENE